MTISLITDNLYIYRMTSRLSETGYGTGQYKISLSEKVFYMVGLKKKDITDELIQWYDQQIRECIYQNSPDLKRKIEVLAIDIFKKLKAISIGELVAATEVQISQ